MTNQPLAPAEIDGIEMPKLDDAMNWLVGFVNNQLAESSFLLAKGEESRVCFKHDDLVHSYRYLRYWCDHYGEIAALFREHGWQVVEYEKAYPNSRMDIAQPALGFKAVSE